MSSKEKKVLGVKQKNITSFLKPLQQKRPAGDTCSKYSPSTKIPKNDSEVGGESSGNLAQNECEGKENESSGNITSPSHRSSAEELVHINFSGLNIEIGKSWKEALKNEFEKDYFKKLSRFVEGERKGKTIYPLANEIFSWTKYYHIKETKIVIIGQDPYHGPQQAHGLCFSVCVGVSNPPSLGNIYKELCSDIPNFSKPDHGYLAGWASQGVLLLNACLTVVASQANSHKDKGWEKFTDATIKWINGNLDGVVFILWGMYAQKKGQSINRTRHLVLSGKHPSPLSAHRGFFGCKHFSKANDYLRKNGKKEIDWSYLPKSV